jgi:hypothetical protein
VAQIDQAGVISSTGGSTHADNIKDKFGTGNDLEIFHDGTHSYIKDVGTGDLRLMGTNLSLRSESTNEPYLNATENGAVDLFHNNVKKFETTATGVTIAGTVASIISANNAQGEIAFGDPEDANIGRIAYNHPSNFLATVVNATEYMRIHSNGVTSIPSGVALGVGTANTASNVLDDYEEGTWTPAIKFGGNAASFATSLNVGFYIKIGHFVHWSFRTTITNKGSSSGNCSVTGLPFSCLGTTGNFGGAHIVFSQNWTADAGMSEEHNQCVIDSGSSSVMLRRIATNGGFNSTTNTQFTNSTQIIMKGEYRVS